MELTKSKVIAHLELQVENAERIIAEAKRIRSLVITSKDSSLDTIVDELDSTGLYPNEDELEDAQAHIERMCTNGER